MNQGGRHVRSSLAVGWQFVRREARLLGVLLVATALVIWIVSGSNWDRYETISLHSLALGVPREDEHGATLVPGAIRRLVGARVRLYGSVESFVPEEPNKFVLREDGYSAWPDRRHEVLVVGGTGMVVRQGDTIEAEGTLRMLDSRGANFSGSAPVFALDAERLEGVGPSAPVAANDRAPVGVAIASFVALACAGCYRLAADGRARREARRAAGRCVHCGYDHRATPGRCPECGRIAVQANA